MPAMNDPNLKPPAEEAGAPAPAPAVSGVSAFSPASTASLLGVTAASLFPGGWPQRLWFVWATTVFPAISFFLACSGLHLADWQKPGSQVWLELLVDQPGAWAFLPLAAAVSLLCLVIALRPGPWVADGVVRAALVTGLILAIQYAFLLPSAIAIEKPWPEVVLAVTEWGAVLLAVAGIAAAWLGAWALLRFLGRRFGAWAPLALVAAAWLVYSFWRWDPWGEGFFTLPRALLEPLGVVVVFSLFAGPIWTAWALGALLRRLQRLSAAPPLSWPALALGLGLFAASWRLALLRVVEAYEKLPPQPPDCFVATAAARAPQRLTGGFTTFSAGGRGFTACPQLQRFKLFELVLQAIFPRGHRALRRVYDRIGPRLAARITTPRRAAWAWRGLRPLEAVAVVAVWAAGGARLVGKAALLYCSPLKAR